MTSYDIIGYDAASRRYSIHLASSFSASILGSDKLLRDYDASRQCYWVKEDAASDILVFASFYQIPISAAAAYQIELAAQNAESAPIVIYYVTEKNGFDIALTRVPVLARRSLSRIPGVKLTTIRAFVPLMSANMLATWAKEYNAVVTAPARQLLDRIALQIQQSIPIVINHCNPRLLRPLLPHQQIGVRFLIERHKAILADDMGLGKTFTAIAAAETAPIYPVLVICPSGLIANWDAELKTNIGIMPFVIDKELTSLPLQNQWLICSMDSLARLRKFRWLPKTLIIDEAHSFKNEKTERYQELLPIAKNATRIWLLSGTPLLNHPKELTSLLDLLSLLPKFGGKQLFLKNYVYSKSEGMLRRLKHILQRDYLLRRTKSEILLELPPKQWTTTFIPLSNEAEYRKAQEDFFIYWTKIRKKKLTVAQTKKLIFQKICTLLELSAIGKIEACVKLLEQFLREGKKCVVFCRYIRPFELLQAAFPHSLAMIKEQSETERLNVSRLFEQEERKILLTTYRVGGQGWNFIKATEAIFLEIDWTPAYLQQAIDRLHRLGQTQTVTGHLLIGERTIDTYVLSRLTTKMKFMQAAIGAGEYEPLAQAFDKIALFLAKKKKK